MVKISWDGYHSRVLFNLHAFGSGGKTWKLGFPGQGLKGVVSHLKFGSHWLRLTIRGFAEICSTSEPFSGTLLAMEQYSLKRTVCPISVLPRSLLSLFTKRKNCCCL